MISENVLKEMVSYTHSYESKGILKEKVNVIDKMSGLVEV